LDKFRKKANKFSMPDLQLASKISAPTEFNSSYTGRVNSNLSTYLVLIKIGKKYQALYMKALCFSYLSFLTKKVYVLCEVRSEIEDKDQDLTTTEPGFVLCAVRAECEDIIDSLNTTTNMLYSLTTAHCC